MTAKRKRLRGLAPLLLLAALWIGASSIATAEPYLAVRSGLKCGMCHVNPAGGGMRTPFGNAWALSEIAGRTVEVGGAEPGAAWTGEVNSWLRVGGNVRSTAEGVSTPEAEDDFEFDVRRATVYAALQAIPDLLTVYLDEQIAPGGAIAREAYALLTPQGGKYTVKAGKFFLPFGLRLEDDSAFIRQVPGINFDTPDHGIEFGLELPRWSTQIAMTNGTAGGGDNDTGKQVSLHSGYVVDRWRVGVSYNHNNSPLGDREMHGIYAGLRTGPIAWLGEIDYVTDELGAGQEREAYVSLLEGNLRVARGHNLKITYEYFDPADDVREDQRERYSVVWEAAPMQMLQARFGLRFYNGVPQEPASNRDQVFAELHVYF